jgi:UDP-GlcNAc3NAcA epimerase
LKIVTIIGARPQFIKASALSRAFRVHNKSSAQKIEEIIIHTGQHFDKNMSNVFFTELEIPHPNYNLEIASLSHGAMTGRMLESIELILIDEQPDYVLIYGDTNSTLAGALAASKLHIPIAHVEAGLRSFNMKMPEEINRILSDKISNLLFCPTETAVENLKNEGIINGVHNVGDVMYDVTLHYREQAKTKVELNLWNIKEGDYALCTIHRAENTDNISRLQSIFSALKEIAKELPIILPIHPRTKQKIHSLKKEAWLNNITILEPLPYLEMLRLEMSAKVILTDSGGIQKEAFFHEVPCVTLRDETEWVETIEMGWNKIVGADKHKMLNAFKSCEEAIIGTKSFSYGDGNTANKILEILINEKN